MQPRNREVEELAAVESVPAAPGFHGLVHHHGDVP
jgi:hypothetical protein